MASRTAAQIKTIKENLHYVYVAYHSILRDPRYQEVASHERWIRLRQHMILKASMVTDNLMLLDHWDIIRTEVDIPWDVHYDRADNRWPSLSNIASYFYTTNLTTGAPVLEPHIDTIRSLSNKAMFKAFGLAGGMLPSESHPPPVVPAP